jgi:hypothetical protein
VARAACDHDAHRMAMEDMTSPNAAREREHVCIKVFRVRKLLFVLGSLLVSTSCGLGALSLDTAFTSTTVGRSEGKVDVLLRIETDDKGWDVDDLLPDADVSLADENTGVVDRLGEAALVDLGLETALQEVFNLESQDVIQPHACLVEHSDAHETANDSVTLEKTLGVCRWEPDVSDRTRTH